MQILLRCISDGSDQSTKAGAPVVSDNISYTIKVYVTLYSIHVM